MFAVMLAIIVPAGMALAVGYCWISDRYHYQSTKPDTIRIKKYGKTTSSHTWSEDGYKKHILHPNDEEYCYQQALLELKAIEMACGLWEPITKKKVIPAEVRKTMIVEPLKAEVWTMDHYDPVRTINITEPEYRIDEVLHPERTETYVAGWKPVEGFVP